MLWRERVQAAWWCRRWWWVVREEQEPNNQKHATSRTQTDLKVSPGVPYEWLGTELFTEAPFAPLSSSESYLRTSLKRLDLVEEGAPTGEGAAMGRGGDKEHQHAQAQESEERRAQQEGTAEGDEHRDVYTTFREILGGTAKGDAANAVLRHVRDLSPDYQK